MFFTSSKEQKMHAALFLEFLTTEIKILNLPLKKTMSKTTFFRCA